MQRAGAWSAASALGAVRECTFPIHWVVISEGSAPWRKGVKDRLDQLCRLQVGWDGYKGRPVDFSTANFALAILEAVCDPETPSPSLIPGSSGDVQIEWHTTDWDLEIDVTGPYRVEAWRQAVGSSDEEERCLTNDFTEVRKWVRQLAEPVIVPQSTAA